MPIKDKAKLKAAQKRADAKRAGRTRNFATIVYPESAPADWKTILQETKVEAFISPLHDSDLNPDGTPKKPHYHVLIMFENVKTNEQASDFIEKIGGVGFEKLGSLRGYARYLCHLDNPEKHQYNPDAVQQLGGADYQGIISLVSDKYQAIREMIQYCTTNEILSYAELLNYAAENNETWFRCLCDNGTLVIKEFLKSLQWEKMMKR